jgi:C4-dicarboxylate transporter DctM subunit
VTTVLLVTFLVLLLLDVPVAFCMMLSALAAFLYAGVDPIMVGLEVSRSMASFYPFLAVPFFILAGDLMNHGGLSQKITDFTRALVGHRIGGMAMVTTISSQMFGAISGASSATCAAIGGVMIPEMEKEGYPRPFATALAACSGTTGALIPPSLMLLVYGVVANVSIEKLFIGGVGPGILMGTGLMVVSHRFARKNKIPVAQKVGVRKIARSAIDAVFALLLVLLIFGGIMGGVFTATEASSVAVVYALIVGFVIYRQLKLRELPRIFVNAGKTAAVLCFITSAAALFAWAMAIGRVPQAMAEGLMQAGNGIVALFGDLDPATQNLVRRIIVLIMLNIALLVVGMFIDGGPAILIVVPILLPVAREIDISLVHFGVLVVSNLVIGLVTPPVGTTLFIASGVGRVKITEMIPHVLRFLLPMVIVQLLITYVPPITLFLPGFLK